MFRLGLDEVFDGRAGERGFALKKRDMGAFVEQGETGVSGSGHEEMMEAKVGLVRAGEVAFLYEAGEIVAGFLDFFDLLRGRTIASESKGGSLQDFAHFANFVDLGVGHLFGKEAPFGALENEAFTKKASQTFANSGAVYAEFFGPKLFDDAIVGGDLQDENAMTKFFVRQLGLGSFSAGSLIVLGRGSDFLN